MEEPRFFNKQAWKGVIIAIVAVVMGQLVLSWQYYRLEEKRLPLIEQQLAEQKQEIERQSAKQTILHTIISSGVSLTHLQSSPFSRLPALPCPFCE